MTDDLNDEQTNDFELRLQAFTHKALSALSDEQRFSTELSPEALAHPGLSLRFVGDGLAELHWGDAAIGCADRQWLATGETAPDFEERVARFQAGDA